MNATAPEPLNDPDRARNREWFMMHLIAVVDAVRRARLETRMRAIRLTIPKHRVLDWVAAASSATMLEIARGTFIDRTTLTRSMDQMVADGLVTRKPSPTDRRKVIIELTPSGAAAAEAGGKVIEEVNAEIHQVLDEDTVRTLNKGLLRLLERLAPDQDIRDHLTGRTGRPRESGAKQA